MLNLIPRFLLTRAELKLINEARRRRATKKDLKRQAVIAREQAYIDKR